MSRTITITILLLALGVGGYFFYQQQQQANADSNFQILREATIEEGRIAATVNATGVIEPEALLSLTFGMGGTIQQVHVVRGQTVQEGDILATLNTEELQLAVQQAQDALNIQQLTLQQALNSQPSPATLATAQADIDAAQAGVQVAQGNLLSAQATVTQTIAQKNQLLAGPTSSEIAAAEASLAQAELVQIQAEQGYNQTTACFDITLPDGSRREECPGLGDPEEQARYNLQNANANLSVAQQRLADLQSGARFADVQAANAAIAQAEASVLSAQGNVASAQANLTRAQANYERLLEGRTADEIAILEAQIAAAETNLALAQLRLDQSQIVAPMSGQVANVLINVGEIAAPGAPALTLINEGAYHITVNVDEIDIDRITVGQAVDITLDAFEGRAVQGEIAEIAPTSTSTSGVVTYLVTINISADDAEGLRAGMSANASIVVQEIERVIVVPNWAIRLDRETGQAYVNVKRGAETVEEVVIETGLRNEISSEVVTGLSVGDVVVLTNERETFSFFGDSE